MSNLKWLFLDLKGSLSDFNSYTSLSEVWWSKDHQHEIWIPTLKADFCRLGREKNIDKYDAFFTSHVNYLTSFRINDFKKKVGDRPIIGYWESMEPPLVQNENVMLGEKKDKVDLWRRTIKENTYLRTLNEINACSLLLHSYATLYSPELFNIVFNTNKFIYIPCPMNFKIYQHYVSKERYPQIMASQVHRNPFFTKYNVEVAKLIRKQIKTTWEFLMTVGGGYYRGRRSKHSVAPFKSIGFLSNFQHYLGILSKSYIGMYNSGGRASMAAQGALMKIPFVGAKEADNLALAFPDLACELTDYKKQADLIVQLITDQSFYREQIKKGYYRAKKIFSMETAAKSLYHEMKEHDLI